MLEHQQKLKIFACPWDMCALSVSPYYSNDRERGVKDRNGRVPVCVAVVASVFMLLNVCVYETNQ